MYEGKGAEISLRQATGCTEAVRADLVREVAHHSRGTRKPGLAWKFSQHESEIWVYYKVLPGMCILVTHRLPSD